MTNRYFLKNLHQREFIKYSITSVIDVVGVIVMILALFTSILNTRHALIGLAILIVGLLLGIEPYRKFMLAQELLDLDDESTIIRKRLDATDNDVFNKEFHEYYKMHHDKRSSYFADNTDSLSTHDKVHQLRTIRNQLNEISKQKSK